MISQSLTLIAVDIPYIAEVRVQILFRPKMFSSSFVSA